MSDRTARRVMIVLSVLGVAIAGYLTYVHYANLKPLCAAGNACEVVQTSSFSKLAGIPVALIGLLGYVAILGSLLGLRGERQVLASSALTVGGLAFSAYLTYTELFQIHKLCEECASSAVVVLVLTGFAIYRLVWSSTAAVPPPGPVGPAPAGDAEPSERAEPDASSVRV